MNFFDGNLELGSSWVFRYRLDLRCMCQFQYNYNRFCFRSVAALLLQFSPFSVRLNHTADGWRTCEFTIVERLVCLYITSVVRTERPVGLNLLRRRLTSPAFAAHFFRESVAAAVDERPAVGRVGDETCQLYWRRHWHWPGLSHGRCSDECSALFSVLSCLFRAPDPTLLCLYFVDKMASLSPHG